MSASVRIFGAGRGRFGRSWRGIWRRGIMARDQVGSAVTCGDASGKSVWYLLPLLHLIKFKVNKVHVALEMHLEIFLL